MAVGLNDDIVKKLGSCTTLGFELNHSGNQRDEYSPMVALFIYKYIYQFINEHDYNCYCSHPSDGNWMCGGVIFLS